VLTLIEQGTMQITAVTGPSVLGYNAAAMLCIKTRPDRPASDVAAELQRIPSVDYVVVTSARYSIFAELMCRDRAALQASVENDIGRIDGIQDIEVLPYLRLHYQNAHFAAARTKAARDTGVRPHPIDETDVSIIRSLSDDGRKPFLQVAEEIGVSEALVRSRFKQLSEAGIVGVIALINPKVEYKSMAWVAVNVAPQYRVIDVADALARLPNTTYIAICAGRFDILTEFICQSEDELLSVIDANVRSLPSIAGLEISIYIDLHYKRLVPIRDQQ
jgi:DNA-binding Lrp family transcriptional regulator